MDKTLSSHGGKRGQSLIEVLIAVFIGILLFAAAASIIAPVLRSNTEVARMQTASSLAKQLMEHVVVFAGSDWHNIDGSPVVIEDANGTQATVSNAFGAGRYYHLTTSTSPFMLKSGEENLEVGTTTYKRYFSVEEVRRDSGGNISPNVSDDLDPSTKNVTVFYSWAGSVPKSFSRYITRTRNNVLVQTDWSGGFPSDPDLRPTLMVSTSTIGNTFASSSNIEFASSVGSLVLSGVGVPPPPPAYVLTVESSANLSSPANIGITQPDLNGQNSGSAPPSFTRTYMNGTSVTLTAPAYPQTSLVFQSWQKNGVVISTNTAVTITMSANTTMKAMYVPVFILEVNSDTSGAYVQVTPDISIPSQGGGSVPFTRRYASGASVTLTVQAPPGFDFLYWTKNGAPIYGNPKTITMTADTEMTAVFEPSLQLDL